MNTWQMILTFIGGGGFLTFVQFLITRHDNKKGKTREILAAIEKLSDEVTQVKEDANRREAVLARTHILRFRDELYNGIEHTSEYFEQTLDDAAAYDLYCEKNPGFRNGRTTEAIIYIREEYRRLFKEHKL